MGSLTLPPAGPVYADSQVFIYSVEKHPVYAAIVRPLWEAVSRGEIDVVTSELTLMETRVGPLKRGDAALAEDYERFLASPGIRLAPLTAPILRAAAGLRATMTSLRTPDALHAATANAAGCSLLITNDNGFRRLSSPAIVFLDDLRDA